MLLENEHNIFDIALVTKNVVYYAIRASHGRSVAQTETRRPLAAKGPSSISGKSISHFRRTKWH